MRKELQRLKGVRICATLPGDDRPFGERMKVNTAWFNDVIRQSPYGSQRRLAPKIRGRNGRPLEPSALSLMFRGKRAMQIDEARQLADLLEVPLVEVLRHAGVSLPDDGTRTVPVIGYIDQNGELRMNGDKEKIPAPTEVPPEAVAVRCRTARSDQGNLDGWIIYAEKPAPPTSSSIGRLCLIQKKQGKAGVAFVSRGYKAGTFNLAFGFCGPSRAVESAHLEWAAPVLWVRP